MERGDQGWGTLCWTPDYSCVTRSGRAVDHGKFVELAAAQAVYNVSAFHVRAPTNGQSTAVKHAHPFTSGPFVMAHNGVLIDWKDVPRYDFWRAKSRLNHVEVDSTVILAGIEHFYVTASLGQAISQTMESVEGQAACWLWDSNQEMMYLWRVMSTLYTHTSADNSTVYFSSTRPTTVGWDLLPQGRVYALAPDYRVRPVVEENAFRYSTPYGRG